jgi:hypothetical protein
MKGRVAVRARFFYVRMIWRQYERKSLPQNGSCVAFPRQIFTSIARFSGFTNETISA